jgi:hypothetical protein
MKRSLLALRFWLFMLLALGFASAGASVDHAEAQPDGKGVAVLPAEWTKAMQWRNIGPANMSGRITAISVFEADPSTYWVATASGGLIKTTNNGVTFEHQFDKEATVSIGDVCVAPSNRNIVWVGAGEGNPRNSVSYGDGVYKSTNGGKTWAFERPSRSAASPFIPRIPTSFTSAPSAGSTATTRNAASSRRPTAANRGRRSFISTTAPA